MSAYSDNAVLYMSWSYSEMEDGRFNRILRNSLVACLVGSVLFTFLPLLITETVVVEEPPRLVTLIFEKKPVPPPPKAKPVERKPRPLPKKVAQPKPVKKVVKKKKVVLVDKTVAARKRAKQSGLLALQDSLSDLRQNTHATSLRQTRQLSHSGGSAKTVQRSLLTSNTAKTSGGISTAGLSSNTGGGVLASRTTTRVHSLAGNAAGASSASGKGKRSAGRSIEEIQMVFDRNKGTIYNVYNRALRKNPSLQGKIVLQLTIAPSGKVLVCTLISSELDDPSLGQNITRRVKLFDFGSKEVSEVTITYPIDFLPA